MRVLITGILGPDQCRVQCTNDTWVQFYASELDDAPLEYVGCPFEDSVALCHNLLKG